jgi:tetratricopeptide (TPR) repeat protein
LEADHDNLRAVLRWAAQSGALEVGLRLAGLVWLFWQQRGYLSEGRRWLEDLLARAEAPQASVALAVRMTALLGAGAVAWWQGDYARARVLTDQGLALAREVGDKRGMAWALNNLGDLAEAQGDYAAAQELFAESLALAQEMGSAFDIQHSYNNLGVVAYHQGDYARAAVLFEQCLVLAREAGSTTGSAWALYNLGNVALEQGDPARAAVLFADSLALFRDMGGLRGIACGLEGLARVVTAPGTKPEALPRATRLLGAAAALRGSVGAPLVPYEQAGYERTVAALRGALGDAAFQATWAAGHALTPEQAIADALDEPSPPPGPPGRTA